jgi:hypothetical protein
MQRVKPGKSDLEVAVVCLAGKVYGWTVVILMNSRLKVYE